MDNRPHSASFVWNRIYDSDYVSADLSLEKIVKMMSIIGCRIKLTKNADLKLQFTFNQRTLPATLDSCTQVLYRIQEMQK